MMLILYQCIRNCILTKGGSYRFKYSGLPHTGGLLGNSKDLMAPVRQLQQQTIKLIEHLQIAVFQ